MTRYQVYSPKDKIGKYTRYTPVSKKKQRTLKVLLLTMLFGMVFVGNILALLLCNYLYLVENGR